MKELQNKIFREKEMQNMTHESVKLKYYQFLKSQSYLGPFSSTEVVIKYIEYMENAKEMKLKNSRMYHKIRYVQIISLLLQSLASVFRMKKDG